jgi:uncharacterized protein YgiM (DUF1202 family)
MNKRILSMIAVIILLATMCVAFVTTASADYCVYSHCRNGKPLNERAGPGKEYAVVGKFPYGTQIWVIGETSPGWLQLNDGSTFVQASQVCSYDPGPYVPPAPGPQPTKKPSESLDSIYATAKTVTPYIVTLKATKNSKGVANVRWAPSKKSKLLAAYPSGTQVRVIAELKNWYQVEDLVTGAVGYVNTAYVVK